MKGTLGMDEKDVELEFDTTEQLISDDEGRKEDGSNENEKSKFERKRKIDEIGVESTEDPNEESGEENIGRFKKYLRSDRMDGTIEEDQQEEDQHTEDDNTTLTNKNEDEENEEDENQKEEREGKDAIAYGVDDDNNNNNDEDDDEEEEEEEDDDEEYTKYVNQLGKSNSDQSIGDGEDIEESDEEDKEENIHEEESEESEGDGNVPDKNEEDEGEIIDIDNATASSDYDMPIYEEEKEPKDEEIQEHHELNEYTQSNLEKPLSNSRSSSCEQLSYQLVQNAYHHQSWCAKETAHLVALLAKTQLYSEREIVNLLLLAKIPMTVEVCEALHSEGISISEEYMIKIVKETTKTLTLTDYVASIIGLIQAELLTILTIKEKICKDGREGENSEEEEEEEEEITEDIVEVNTSLLQSIISPPSKEHSNDIEFDAPSSTVKNELDHSLSSGNSKSPSFSDWIQLYFGILQYYDKFVEKKNYIPSRSLKNIGKGSNSENIKENEKLDENKNLLIPQKISIEKKEKLKLDLAGLIQKNLYLEEDQLDFIDFIAQEGITIQ